VSSSRPLLDDGARAVLKQPVSIIFGSVDELNTPDATRASGAAVLDDRRLRVLIAADCTARLNARPGTQVSVLVTDVTTYQSVQWKGRVLHGPIPRTAGDIALSHEYLTRFRAGLVANGLSPEQIGRLCSLDTVAIEVEVDEQFDQTPGRDAGRKVAG